MSAAYAVHTELGPGLLESAYKACLLYELNKRGIPVEAEVPVPLIYEGKKLGDVGTGWISLSPVSLYLK